MPRVARMRDRNVVAMIPGPITLLLCGDVMTGRGVDQILPHPGDPRLHESYVTDAGQYVEMAELRHGPILRPVSFAYPWGDALGDLQALRPDIRIVNLETSITRSDAWMAKGINYRMNPANLPCLTAFGIDCCTLANNHVMDWGAEGLLETIATLRAAGISATGVGRDIAAAEVPAILPVAAKGRVVIYGFATTTSGVPPEWAAAETRAGVCLLPDLSRHTVRKIAERLWRDRQPGDVAVASIHWGGNWGFHIPPDQRAFAHALIDEAGIDIVHGHSSHHVRAIEIYRDKLVLYGCGDFLNDYEGISGHEEFRDDLVLAYLPAVQPDTGRLVELTMLPYRIRNMRLGHPSAQEVAALARMLGGTGAGVEIRMDGTLTIGRR